jgi:FAD synthetase
MNIKVMVFGVFDGLHKGHRAMLKEAKQYGDYLMVAVAQNHIVQHLKGHLPKLDIAERIAHLQAEDCVDEVIIGDAELGIWKVVKKYRPDVIACGYDQKDLKRELENALPNLGYTPRIVTLKSFEPNIYHSSLLNK